MTFDENDDQSGYYGLTNPLIGPNPQYSPRHNRLLRGIQNRIVTIFAGAHIKPGWYAEGKGITHLNILRTIEAMYGLPKSGRSSQMQRAVALPMRRSSRMSLSLSASDLNRGVGPPQCGSSLVCI